ncbi:MAG: hypothetical protein SGPRY_012812, partial [Prymnesium sp.]
MSKVTSSAEDIVGFSAFEEKHMLWVAHLKPALSKIELLKVIFNSTDLEKYFKKPMKQRVDHILEHTESALEAQVSEVSRKDARLV